MTDQPGWTGQPQDQPPPVPAQPPVPYQQQGYAHGYQQQGYPYGYQQPGYAYALPPPTNTMAIIALVLALTVAPGGLICGIIARRQIRETGESGDGLALAAMIVGGILTAMYVIPFLIWLVVFVVGVIILGAGG